MIVFGGVPPSLRVVSLVVRALEIGYNKIIMDVSGPKVIISLSSNGVAEMGVACFSELGGLT